MLYERVVRQPQSLPSVRGLSARILDLEVQDPLAPDTPSLMYDAEYLSLRQDPSRSLWVDFPSQEVGLSFSRGLLQWQAMKIQEQEDAQGSSKKKHLDEHMESAFHAADYEAFGNMFNTYLRRFPFGMFPTPASRAEHGPGAKNQESGLLRKPLPSMELYYHALLCAFFVVRSLDVTAFAINEQGEADLALMLSDRAVIIDFNIFKSPLAALEQIRTKNYRSTFDQTGLPVEGLGFTIDPRTRQVTKWQVAYLGWSDPESGVALPSTNSDPRMSLGALSSC